MVHACHMLRSPITSLTTGETDYFFFFARALIRMHKIQIVPQAGTVGLGNAGRLRIEFETFCFELDGILKRISGRCDIFQLTTYA
jgi:hypothetical protein